MVAEFELDLPKKVKFIHTTRLNINKLIEYGKWKWVYEDETIYYDMVGDNESV
jgi:hypothetical protein